MLIEKDYRCFTFTDIIVLGMKKAKRNCIQLRTSALGLIAFRTKSSLEKATVCFKTGSFHPHPYLHIHNHTKEKWCKPMQSC